MRAVNPPAIPARPSRIPPHPFRRFQSRARPEPVPWQMALRRRGRQGWAELLSPKTCEKIVLFHGAACRKFPRTSWRRCLTPGRAEFSRHAGEFPACSAAKQPIFEVVFGESNSAQPCRPLRRKAICQGQAPAVRGTGRRNGCGGIREGLAGTAGGLTAHSGSCILSEKEVVIWHNFMEAILKK